MATTACRSGTSRQPGRRRSGSEARRPRPASGAVQQRVAPTRCATTASPSVSSRLSRDPAPPRRRRGPRERQRLGRGGARPPAGRADQRPEQRRVGRRLQGQQVRRPAAAGQRGERSGQPCDGAVVAEQPAAVGERRAARLADRHAGGGGADRGEHGAGARSPAASVGERRVGPDRVGPAVADGPAPRSSGVPADAEAVGVDRAAAAMSPGRPGLA